MTHSIKIPACTQKAETGKKRPSRQRNIARHGKQGKYGHAGGQHPQEYGLVPDEKQRSQPDERGNQQHVVPQGIKPMAMKQGMQGPGGTAAVAKITRGFIEKALRQPAGPEGSSTSRSTAHAAASSARYRKNSFIP